MKLFLIALFTAFLLPLHSQYIPHNPSDNDIYTLLDEIHPGYNSSVKPLGRVRILELLEEIDLSTLNSRQQKEVAFYLKDFNKEKYLHKDFPRRLDALYLRDSSFSLTINPIGGGILWTSSEGSIYH